MEKQEYNFKRFIHLPLVFGRPAWDAAGSISRIEWAGRMAVAAVYSACNRCAYHRAQMEAHRLDYTARVIRIQQCNLRRPDGVATREMEEAALEQVQGTMERQEALMRTTLDAEELQCAWAVGEYEAADKERVDKARRVRAALKKARLRAEKAIVRYKREEAERQRAELVANIKREAREEIRTMRALRRAEQVEAMLLSLTTRKLSEARRRGGRRGPGAQADQRRRCGDWRLEPSLRTEASRRKSRKLFGNESREEGSKPERRKPRATSDSSVLAHMCRMLGHTYDMIVSVSKAVIADVIPASVFSDVLCKIRDKREFRIPALWTSSIASPVLLVSTLCQVHKQMPQVWRAGACLIDSMSRLGYG